eukprot:SM000240S08604  [mRNA]  locus=s240:89:1801:+ [translate_table: standard]
MAAFPGADVLLRILPLTLSVVTANYMHYTSLRKALAQARRPATHGCERPRVLSYDLMKSPTMRSIRYPINAVRYATALLYLLLVWRYLPELRSSSEQGPWTFLPLIAGLAGGALTVILDENAGEAMRTSWRPHKDLGKSELVVPLDIMRLVGSCITVPLEEELVFHSWMYRALLTLRLKAYHHFTDVPFQAWNWPIVLLTNAVFGILHGTEWKSAAVSGLMFQMASASSGRFLDGVLAHSCANLVVGVWVLTTNERQFW